MKKESNGGLFFLLAVGIMGLGLYFAAAEDYSAGELQLYHIVCWAVLIAALLRVLELIWGRSAGYGIRPGKKRGQCRKREILLNMTGLSGMKRISEGKSLSGMRKTLRVRSLL